MQPFARLDAARNQNRLRCGPWPRIARDIAQRQAAPDPGEATGWFARRPRCCHARLADRLSARGRGLPGRGAGRVALSRGAGALLVVLHGGAGLCRMDSKTDASPAYPHRLWGADMIGPARPELLERIDRAASSPRPGAR